MSTLKITNQATLRAVMTELADRPLPQTLVDEVHRALDERPRDEWVVEACHRIARNLRDDWRKGVTDDTAHDVADYLSDIGPDRTAALYAWFASDVERNAVLCDDANHCFGTWEMLFEEKFRDEFMNDVPDMLSNMQRGQLYALQMIATAFIEQAVMLANARDAAADDSSNYVACEGVVL